MASLIEKKKILKILNSRVALHFYFWATIWTVAFIVERIVGTSFKSQLGFFAFLFILFFPVYSHFYILETFFTKKKYIFYLLGLFIILYLSAKLIRIFGSKEFVTYNSFAKSMFHIFLLIVISTGLKFLRSGSHRQIDLRRKKLELLRLELRRTQARINPESIQKKLNHLYNLSQDQPEKVPEQLLELSADLRNQLKAAPEAQESVGGNFFELEKENTPKRKGKIFQLLNSRIAYNIYYVVFIFIFFILARGSKGSLGFQVEALTFFLLLTIPVNIHFFLLDRLFNREKKILYFISVIFMIFFVAYFFNWLSFELFLLNSSFIQSILEILFVLIIVTAGKVVKDGFKQRVKIQDIEDRQLQMEINLLKSQVNPHFLFNTFNNFYALSLDRSEKLPQLFLKLSDLLKYMSESSSKNVVTLKEEFDFIENYLELEKIRLSHDREINLNVTGDLSKKVIAPMLLIPFIENSFKHGINTKSKDFYVSIYLVVSREGIVFVVENSKGGNFKKKSRFTGTGLINVKRRLELLYSKCHNLTIEEGKSTFKITLEINL